MKTNKEIYLLSALIMAGCSHSPGVRYDSGQLATAPRRSVSSVLIKKDMECYYPVKMAKCDMLFIVQDLQTAGHVNIFSSQGEYVDCLVKKGHGREEVSSLPTMFSLDKRRGVVSVFANPYLVEYDVREFMEACEDYSSKTDCSVLLASSAHDVKRLADRYLLEGFTNDMRFAVADNNSRSVYVEYPLILPWQDDDATAAVLTYASRVAVSPDATRWVQVSYIGAVLETFELRGGDIRSMGMNPIYRPVYDGEGNDVGWCDETTIGFDDVVATDKCIYALLNGTQGKNLKSNPPVRPFTNEITVFDWNGDIKQIISTDCMMMTIDIDEDEDVCYAIAFNPDRGCDLRKIPLGTSECASD